MKNNYAPNIEPRDFKFSTPENPPKYWHSNSDVKTYHFNALAFFLPQLEKMLVLSLKKAKAQVKNPALKSEVASLVAQEAIHGRSFVDFSDQIVFKYYNLPKHYSLWFFRGLAGALNKLSKTFHYSLSAAGEHFTAIAADLFLRDPQWFEDVPKEYSAIWRWHCIEEIEHKHVAFDVFTATNGNYFVRIAGMILMTFFFMALYLKPIWLMMKQDNKHKDHQFYCRAWRYYWGKGGLYRALWQPYWDYFKPSFHPNHHQNDHLIAEWKAYFRLHSAEQITKDLELTQPPITVENGQ